MRLRSITLLCVASLLGCLTEHPPVAADSSGVGYRQQGRVAESAPRLSAAVQFEGITVTGESPLPFTSPADASAAMLIRTATASIEVDSLEIAIDRTKQLAARVGGFVATSTVDAGRNRLRSATLEIKLPAQRFEEGLAGLSPIGKLETVNVSAEDVGEEYVDVTARMENARRLERRLIDLLANRTGKLKDVLAVEESLAQVREQIERYEGRMRYLRTHAAMSTLSVNVHEPLPVVGTAGHSVMGDAFRQAWRNFVVLAAVAVQSLGVILPLGVIAVAVLMVRRRVIKQRVA